MKMKTFAMLAASGLMAASLAYVLPAFAEDANDIDGAAPMQLAMGDDAAADSGTSDGGSNTMDNNTGSGAGSAATTAPSASNNAAGATSDQPAQGDDDY